MILAQPNFSHSPLYSPLAGSTFVSRKKRMNRMSNNYPVEQLLSLCDKAQLGMALVNNEAELLTLNNSLQGILEFPKEEFLAKPFSSLLHPEDRQDARLAVRSVFNGMNFKTQAVVRWISASGKVVWARITLLPSTENEKVKATAVILVEEIAEKTTEKIGLSRTDAILRFLNSHHAEIIFLMDAEGNYLWVSPNVSSVLGFFPENLQNRNHFDLIHKDDRSQYTVKCSEKRVSFFDEKQNYRLKHRTGEFVDVSAEHNLIYDGNGKIRYILCNARNLSQSGSNSAEQNLVEETKKAQQSERTTHDNQSSQDASSASFDPPAPLQFISKYPERLKNQVKPGLELISTINEEHNAEGSPLHSLSSEFEMNDLIKIALQNIRKNFPDVPCIFSFPQNFTLHGQRSTMTQIWCNLILNAYQYRNPERILEIHISKEETEEAVIYNFVSNANHSAQVNVETQAVYKHCSQMEEGVAGTGKGTNSLNDLISKVNGSLEQLKDSVSMRLQFLLPLNEHLDHSLKE